MAILLLFAVIVFFVVVRELVGDIFTNLGIDPDRGYAYYVALWVSAIPLLIVIGWLVAVGLWFVALVLGFLSSDVLLALFGIRKS